MNVARLDRYAAFVSMILLPSISMGGQDSLAKTATPTPVMMNLSPTPSPTGSTPSLKHRPRKLSRIPTPSLPNSGEIPATSDQPFSPEHLKGRVGIGVTDLNLVGTSISFRNWSHEDEAYEFSLGFYDNPNTGMDFNGDFLATPHWGYGLSVGIRHNWKKPAEDVYVQWTARLGFSQTYNRMGDINKLVSDQNQVLWLGVGPGFEAFIPFWKNISVEGSVLFNLTSKWSQSDRINNPNFSTNILGPNMSSWVVSFGWDNNLTSNLTGAVHFYF